MIRVKVRITDDYYSWFLVGVLEEQGLPRDEGWEQRHGSGCAPICLSFLEYRALCRDGRKYAKKRGYTFCNILL